MSPTCLAQDAAEIRLAPITGPSTPNQRNVHSLFAWSDRQVLFSAGPDFTHGQSYLTDGTGFEPIDLPPDQARGFFWDLGVLGSVTPSGQPDALRNFVLRRSGVKLVTESPDGTHLIAPLFETPIDDIWRNQTVGLFDGLFYFTSEEILYRTDGSDVLEMGQISPFWDSRGYTQRGDAIYFLQWFDSGKMTLHKTDGPGIDDVDIRPATELLGPPIVKDDVVYFAADGPDGRKIYALNEAGTVSAVTDLPANGVDIWKENGDALYFLGGDNLYHFDGAQVTLVTEGPLTVEIEWWQSLTQSDGHLYFVGVPPGRTWPPSKDRALYRVDGVSATPVSVYEDTSSFTCAPLGGTQTIYFFADGLPYAFDTQTQTTTALSDTLILNGNTDTEYCPAVVAGDRLFMVSGDDLYVTERCPSGTLGDANLDGEVTFADFLVLSANFNQSGGWQRGDFDCDNLVGFSDFLMLSANYGVTSDMGTGAQVENVPEPSEWVNVMVAVLAFGGFGRKRRPTSDP